MIQTTLFLVCGYIYFLRHKDTVGRILSYR